MSAGPDLVSLLYRADWTQLTLSAVSNHGTSVLVAPGRRYRVQAAGSLTGCDGDRPWRLRTEHARDGDGPDADEPDADEWDADGWDADGPDADGEVHWVSGPEPPLPDLLCPAWVLISSQLEVRGPARACGRDALRVGVTRRGGLRRRGLPGRFRAGRAEILVDAELGILLRAAWLADDAEPEVTELVSLEIDPVIEPALFAPPPGSLIAESMGDALRAGGHSWTLLKTVAGVAAGGLGATIRYAPPSQQRTADQDGEFADAISPDGPAPDRSADGRPAGPTVSAEVLALLHDSVPGGFAATVHHWTDLGAMLSQVPDGARRAGFGGLGLLINSITERPATSHLSCSLRVDEAGRYRIDYSGRNERQPVTVACDGQQSWQVYQDRVTTGPAEPPPSGVAELIDPSWLLGCQLSGGTAALAGDRQAYRLNVVRGPLNSSLSIPRLFPAAVAVVDAETGIVVRLTSYIGDRPVHRFELRDITPVAGDLTIDVPPDLPVTEETGPGGHPRGGPYQTGFPWKAAGAAAGQAAAGVATAVAKEAAKAAGGFLRRLTER